MTPQQFELEVARLLARDGWTILKAGGGAGDEGIDVLAEWNGRRLGVQCKRYSYKHPLSAPAIQRYLGAPFHVHKVREMLVVTSGPVTKPARSIAARSAFPVRIIDGQEFLQWQSGRAMYLPGQGLCAR